MNRLADLSSDTAAWVLDQLADKLQLDDLSLIFHFMLERETLLPIATRERLADGAAKQAADRNSDELSTFVPLLVRLAQHEARLEAQAADDAELPGAASPADDAVATQAAGTELATMTSSSAPFARALRQTLKVDSIKDKDSLIAFLSRNRTTAGPVLAPQLEAVLLPLAATLSLRESLEILVALRTKSMLSARTATAFWSRIAGHLETASAAPSSGLRAAASGSTAQLQRTPAAATRGRTQSQRQNVDRGVGLAQLDASPCLAAARVLHDVQQLFGSRGAHVADLVVTRVNEVLFADSKYELPPQFARGGAVEKRVEAYFRRQRRANLLAAAAEKRIASPAELIDFLELYSREVGGVVEGFDKLAVCYAAYVEALSAAGSDDAESTVNAAETQAAQHELARLLRCLSKADSWPESVELFVSARMRQSVAVMDGKTLGLILRAIAKHPGLCAEFAPLLLDRLAVLAPTLELDEASAAVAGLTEFDAETFEGVIVAHDALCQRFLAVASAPDAKIKNIVLVRYLETMSALGYTDEMLGAVVVHLGRVAKTFEGRQAASALASLSKLHVISKPQMLFDLLSAADHDGSPVVAANAVVAAAEFPLEYCDRLARMFVKVMTARDVYINNKSLRADLEGAARQYLSVLPTKVMHTFVRSNRKPADWADLS